MALVPLKFPHCPVCNTDSPRSYHKDCGGELNIDPYSQHVHCLKCCRSWHINESNYYCSDCGNVFSAEEVNDELKKMLAECERLLDIMESRNEAIAERLFLGKSSFRRFVMSFAETLGKSAGYLVEIIVGLFFH